MKEYCNKCICQANNLEEMRRANAPSFSNMCREFYCPYENEWVDEIENCIFADNYKNVIENMKNAT